MNPFREKERDKASLKDSISVALLNSIAKNNHKQTTHINTDTQVQKKRHPQTNLSPQTYNHLKIFGSPTSFYYGEKTF